MPWPAGHNRVFGVHRYARFWKNRFLEGTAARERAVLESYIGARIRGWRAQRGEVPPQSGEPLRGGEPLQGGEPRVPRSALQRAAIEVFAYLVLIGWITWITLSAGYPRTNMDWLYYLYAALIIPLSGTIVFSRVRAIINRLRADQLD